MSGVERRLPGVPGYFSDEQPPATGLASRLAAAWRSTVRVRIFIWRAIVLAVTVAVVAGVVYAVVTGEGGDGGG
ncbi:MAG TPA: hypothetical protein VKG82_10175 [Solirubrobacteraceae bacterium]|nr:hypothetical protein [Solirubrobacteraceae bacterium]HME02776.1 hypothetical protein [Solirubrobacteraceae bacterium]